MVIQIFAQLRTIPRTSALIFPLLFAGCGGFGDSGLPDDGYRLACGRQCLKNGEQCSQFFGIRNEESRLRFEQNKANYWLCKRRYSENQGVGDRLCVPPGPSSQMFDHCGHDLEECLAGCPVTLNEMQGLQKLTRENVTTPREGTIHGTAESDNESH